MPPVCQRSRRMRFVDLFAGLGGFHVAARGEGGECTYAAEIDEDLSDSYEKNFGIKPVGDIRKVRLSEIPEHDLVCAGFPCQPFSKAGSQSGWNDKNRGVLFDYVEELISARRPEFVLLENVANFVNHNKGKSLRRVLSSLVSLGYEPDFEVLSPHNYGVPHIRDRMFVVARRGTLGNFTWPEPIDAPDVVLKDVLEEKPEDAREISIQQKECLSIWQEFLDQFPSEAKLPSFPIWSMEFGATYPTRKKNLYEYSQDYVRRFRGSYGLRIGSTDWKDGFPAVPPYSRRSDDCFPDWKRRFIQQNRELGRDQKEWIEPWSEKIRGFPVSYQKLEWNCQGEVRDLYRHIIQFRASGIRVKRSNAVPSLVAMTLSQIPVVGWEQRYLTLKECARLQSLETLEHWPSLSKAYTALGNAVNAHLARLVLGNLVRA